MPRLSLNSAPAPRILIACPTHALIYGAYAYSAHPTGRLWCRRAPVLINTSRILTGITTKTGPIMAALVHQSENRLYSSTQHELLANLHPITNVTS